MLDYIKLKIKIHHKIIIILYNNIMKSLKQFFIMAGIFLLLCYPVFIFFAPTKIEIIPTETEIQAKIYKKTILNPFNKKVIPNLKEAMVTESIEGRIRLELKDFQGHRFPVTSYKHSGYQSETKLQNKINDAIKNKTYFKYKISSGNLIKVILILALILLPMPKAWFYISRYGDTAEDDEEY